MELEEIKESIKSWFNDKLKNPYYAAVIAVWLITNRVAVFSVFNFTDDIKVQDRISLIQSQLQTKTIWLFSGFYGIIFYSFLLGFVTMVIFNYINVSGKWVYNYFGRGANYLRAYIEPLKWTLTEDAKKDRENLLIAEQEINIKKTEIKVLQKENDDAIAFFNKTKKDIENNATVEKTALKTELSNFQIKLKEKETEIEGYKPIIYDNITQAFDKNSEWQNHYIYPDGTDGIEFFKCDNNGFIFDDGKKYQIKNIQVSHDGKLLSFDKIIGNSILRNILIQDGNQDFNGVEDGYILISYKKQVKPYIEIISAKYYSENNYIDVKWKLQKLVINNQTKIIPTNSLMGGDPFAGKQKEIEVNYIINGIKKTVTGKENELINLE